MVQPIGQFYSLVQACQFVAYQNGGGDFLARVYRHDSYTAAQQSEITSITCKVFDLDSDTPTTAIITPAITVSDVIFNSLQTDARWTVDSTGFNFRHELLATAFPTGQHRYRVEYKITPTDGAAVFLVFDGFVKRTLS